MTLEKIVLAVIVAWYVVAVTALLVGLWVLVR